MSRATDRQISFADLEFIHQHIELEPTLQAIADFIDTHAAIVEHVRRDLERGLKQPTTGRKGLTAQRPPVGDPDAREELGLSRAARTDRGRVHVAVLRPVQ